MFSRLERVIILLFINFTNLSQQGFTCFAVEKCPGTDVLNIRHQTESNEISLIFYYTQWSDDSLEALQQFNELASYFEDKAYFAAVDCWHLSCNCSKTLSTTVGSGSPHKWPTLIVYYGRLNKFKIQYNGLFAFNDMVQFIMNVMQPLERIGGIKDLETIKSFTDNIVLGAFENANCLEFKQYLMASLKWLEYDPIRTYRFTVTFVTAKKNLKETNIKVPSILVLNNKTKKSFTDYGDLRFNTSNVLQWLHEELNYDYRLLYGYSTPVAIGQKIKKQPVLAVFVNEPQHFFQYMEKFVDNQKSYTEDMLACTRYQKRIGVENFRKNSLLFLKIMQNLNISNDNSKCRYDRNIIIRNLNFYYEINQYFEFYQTIANLKKSSSYYKPDLEVRDLLHFFRSTICLQKRDIALQTALHISVTKKLEAYIANEHQCKGSNRSLAVILLDTQRYKDFLTNLDISPTHKSMATVFIIDNNNESLYVMENRFDIFTLMEFIKKFHSNSLSNYFKNKENTPGTSSILMSYRDYDFKLKQLNRNMFLNYLHYIHNQTLIVLIYSPDCALCGNIQHSFLQLSLSLRHIADLKFIRINTMDNDLPWQFNMPFLPALLVFPENRFSESRVFPTYLKPDVRNVFGFILAQLSAHQQVRLVLAMCQSETLSKSHSQSCWQFAKTILMQHIGKHLQYWQLFEEERILILERLRFFKDMSLDIQRNLRL